MRLPRLLILGLLLAGVIYADEPRVVRVGRLFDEGPTFADNNPLIELEGFGRPQNPFSLFQPKFQGKPIWSAYPEVPSLERGPGTYPSGQFKLNLWGGLDLSDKDGQHSLRLDRISGLSRVLRRDDTYSLGSPRIQGTAFPSGVLWSDRVVYPFSVKGSDTPVGGFVVDAKTGKLTSLVTSLPEHDEERFLMTTKQTLAMKLLDDSIPFEEVLKAVESGADVNAPVTKEMRIAKRSKRESTRAIVAWDAQDGLRALEQFPRVEGEKFHSLPNFCFFGRGMTPLASALVSCRADIVTLLLEKGADRDAKVGFIPQDCLGVTQYAPDVISLQKLIDLREEAAKDFYLNKKNREGQSAAQDVKERWVSCNDTNKTFANFVKAKTGSYTTEEEVAGREDVILRSRRGRGAINASGDPTAKHTGATPANGNSSNDPTPRPRYSEEEQAEKAREAEATAKKQAEEAAKVAAEAEKAAAEETQGREGGFLKRKK